MCIIQTGLELLVSTGWPGTWLESYFASLLCIITPGYVGRERERERGGFVRIYLEGQCSPEVDAGWLRHLEGSPWFSL